jgi:hypothetical protein
MSNAHDSDAAQGSGSQSPAGSQDVTQVSGRHGHRPVKADTIPVGGDEGALISDVHEPKHE